MAENISREYTIVIRENSISERIYSGLTAIDIQEWIKEGRIDSETMCACNDELLKPLSELNEFKALLKPKPGFIRRALMTVFPCIVINSNGAQKTSPKSLFYRCGFCFLSIANLIGSALIVACIGLYILVFFYSFNHIDKEWFIGILAASSLFGAIHCLFWNGRLLSEIPENKMVNFGKSVLLIVLTAIVIGSFLFLQCQGFFDHIAQKLSNLY